MITDPPILQVAEKADCRYTVCAIVSKRARQLVAGAPKLIDTKEEKPVSVAVREVNAGAVTYVREENEA
ncbi:MAG: DNA-directed RNA polymerase subunit omega [Clostridia bacterium]|nr:DNA-directed RNA polymerase subunit omega [Clostridia bacterium]